MSNHKLNSQESVPEIWSCVNTWTLRLEGIALLLVSTFLYFRGGGSFWQFLLVLFFPDVSMLGYLMGTKVGTACYNLLHNTVFPLFLVFLGVYMDEPWLVQVALIWLAHLGLDRSIGFGLKYPTHFKDTHLHRLVQR